MRILVKQVLSILERILLRLDEIYEQGKPIMSELDELKAKVAASITAQESARLLIVGLKAKLDAAIASGDPAQLTALSSALDTETTALSAAVVANTPADPAANPAPPAPAPSPATP